MVDALAFGVIHHLRGTRQTVAVGDVFERIRALGFTTCQIGIWSEELLDPAFAEEMRQAALTAGVAISSLWYGWPGPQVWDLVEGPITLGLVPPAYRALRLEFLKKGSDFARQVGVSSITTHVGFIPENPNDPLYPELVVALKDLALHCQRNGQDFRFETGQETPVTLLRTIHDVGTGNLGINLDPANLLLYGKANPVDAVDIYGTYVQGVHIKDGEYPTDGRSLGRECPVGHGRVNFRALLSKLYALGYRGPLTIEREITGEEQVADIKRAVELLTPIVAELRGSKST